MSLLTELKRLKPKFPETDCYIPEWDRTIILRSLSVRESRDLRAESKGEASEAENERLMIRTLAHAIVDGEKRPLANADGEALIDSLSAKTVQSMLRSWMELTGIKEDLEKNLAQAGDGSSLNSPAISTGQLPN